MSFHMVVIGGRGHVGLSRAIMLSNRGLNNAIYDISKSAAEGRHAARGVVMSLKHPESTNNDFNMSTPVGHMFIELAEAIRRMIYGDSKLVNYVLESGFE